LSFPEGFHCGKFCFLFYCSHFCSMHMSLPNFDKRKYESKNQGKVKGFFKEIGFIVFYYMIGAHTHYKEAGKNIGSAYGMDKFLNGKILGYNGEEICQFCSAVTDFIPQGMLHPGICNEYPYGRKVGSKGNQPHGKSMKFR